jgi:uncharacterized protein YecT (DUF1311 family)
MVPLNSPRGRQLQAEFDDLPSTRLVRRAPAPERSTNWVAALVFSGLLLIGLVLYRNSTQIPESHDTQAVPLTDQTPPESQAKPAVPTDSSAGDAAPIQAQVVASPRATDSAAAPTRSDTTGEVARNLPTVSGQAPVVVYEGPSFDCSKAANPTALAICRNAELSELDRHLAVLFNGSHDATNPNARAQQRQWIKQRNQTCGVMVDCLRREFNDRIRELQQAQLQSGK